MEKLDSRWQQRKMLNSLLPMDTTNIQLHMKFLLKETKNWDERSLHQKVKKESIETHRRDRKTISPKNKTKNPTPGTVIYKQEGYQKYEISPWGVRGLCHIRHPNSLISHEKEKPPKRGALRIHGNYVQEHHRTVGNKEPTFKGLHTDSLSLGPSKKTPIWKVPRLHVKETHLLILKWLPKRRETVGTFSRDEDTGGCHICDHIIPC